MKTDKEKKFKIHHPSRARFKKFIDKKGVSALRKGIELLKKNSKKNDFKAKI